MDQAGRSTEDVEIFKRIRRALATGSEQEIDRWLPESPDPARDLYDACWDLLTLEAGHPEVDHGGMIRIALKRGIGPEDLGGLNLLLRQAVGYRHPEVVEELINAGAEVNQTCGDDGRSLLYKACLGNPTVALLLLDAGADVTRAERDESTVLHAAIENGSPELVKRLVLEGADVNTVDYSWRRDGYTPLQFAAKRKNPEIVPLLLDLRADINARAKPRGLLCMHAGMTAEQIARESGNPDVKAVFAAYHAKQTFSLIAGLS